MKKSKRNNKKKKFDGVTLIIAVAALAIVISIISKGKEPAQEALKIRQIVLNDVGSSMTIDEGKLVEINSMDYQVLKTQLNVKKDFCIMIEDEKGNVLLSKGSPDLNKDGFCVN